MNAEEARKKAISISLSRISNEYNTVKSEIEEKVNGGKLFLIYNDSLCSDVITKLKLEGFDVGIYQSGNNEYSYEIKW